MKPLETLIGIEKRKDGTWWVVQEADGSIVRNSGAEPAFQVMQTMWLDTNRRHLQHAMGYGWSIIRWHCRSIAYLCQEWVMRKLSRTQDRLERKNKKG